MQDYTAQATRWVYGWSRLVSGYKQAEVAEVKPSQNLPFTGLYGLTENCAAMARPYFR